jgi:tight adherence protein B
MGPNALLIIGVFVGVAALIVAPYYLFIARAEAAAEDLLRQRIRTGGTGTSVSRRAGLLKDVEKFSTIGPLNTFLSGDSRVASVLRDTIQLSGVQITPGQLILGSACLAMVVYLLLAFRSGQPAVGGVFGVLAAFIPYFVVRFLRNRRLHQFEEQFPEAVDLIGRTLRAGHAFTTGLNMVAEELPQPVSGQFKMLFDQQNYGMPLPDALKEFARRVPLIDARFFVTAVLTQREAGGNLAEVLDNLGAVIRERFKIKRQLRVLTAHGRMTGIVLAMLPPVMALYMFISKPEHFRVLYEDPFGVKMIITALVLQVIGAFLIYKISDVEY